MNQKNTTDFKIALAGNPNVGKSTIFNALTGMNQHTGNWPGKTVDVAHGIYKRKNKTFHITDLPGTYSLIAHSAEEEVTSDFICFENPDRIIAVCDATCLERNLNLVIQILEVTDNVTVCINLMDEAEKKGITIDAKKLSSLLGIPVVTAAARYRKKINTLRDSLISERDHSEVLKPHYTEEIEKAIQIIAESLERESSLPFSPRWAAIRLLEGEKNLCEKIFAELLFPEKTIIALEKAEKLIYQAGICREALRDTIVFSIVKLAENIAEKVTEKKEVYGKKERTADKILTGSLYAYPVMLALLCLVFWITIYGANYPSALIDSFFGKIKLIFAKLLTYAGSPPLFTDLLINGIYEMPARVISVMLPPMAIFFPLFSILEDSGYLPRIAYNLDAPFRKCSACGKQSLTM